MSDLEEMISEGKDIEEQIKGVAVRTAYFGFISFGRPHRIALEDTNTLLNITNAQFYIDAHTIPFIDLSEAFEIEWTVWKNPYQRIIGNWVSLDE